MKQNTEMSKKIAKVKNKLSLLCILLSKTYIHTQTGKNGADMEENVPGSRTTWQVMEICISTA